jgi:hypothetical protein
VESNCNFPSKNIFDILVYVGIFFDLNLALMSIMEVDLEIHLLITFHLGSLFCLCLFSQVFWVDGFSSQTLNRSLIIWIIVVAGYNRLTSLG